MNKDIETLIKIQGKLNKNRYHLSINTDLESHANWRLYQAHMALDEYFSSRNSAILISDVDTIEDLKKYLEKHNGFEE